MEFLDASKFLVMVLACSQGFSSLAEDMETSSLVKKLTAACSTEGIRVNVRFTIPFKGIVYSHGHYDTPGCVFINLSNSTTFSPPETKFSFLIPADECGTVFHDPGLKLNENDSNKPTHELDNEVYLENTVMFQRHHYIQEQGDLAQTLRCVWQKEIRRPLHATLPLTRRKQTKPYIPDKQNTTLSSHQHTQNSQFASSSQQQESPSPKRFQAKGQVESISFGRRHGKSIDHSARHWSKDESNTLRAHNLTALAFKADDTNGASSFLNMSCVKNVIGLHHFVLIINVMWSRW